MNRYIIEVYFGGASPHDEDFILTALNRDEALEKVREILYKEKELPDNIFYSNEGEKCYYKTPSSWSIKSTEILPNLLKESK